MSLKKEIEVLEKRKYKPKSLLTYVQALEAYGYELDEEWDKLLKTIEQAREEEPKSVREKGETKKTFYEKIMPQVVVAGSRILGRRACALVYPFC